MTKQEILDQFRDINHAYNNCTKLDTLSAMLDELLEAAKQWISVKDRLPNDYQPVIVSDGEETEFAIFYDLYNGYGQTFVTPDCYEEERIEGITHWMPLPEPPK